MKVPFLVKYFSVLGEKTEKYCCTHGKQDCKRKKFTNTYRSGFLLLLCLFCSVFFPLTFIFHCIKCLNFSSKYFTLPSEN